MIVYLSGVGSRAGIFIRFESIQSIYIHYRLNRFKSTESIPKILIESISTQKNVSVFLRNYARIVIFCDQLSVKRSNFQYDTKMPTYFESKHWCSTIQKRGGIHVSDSGFHTFSLILY